MNVAGLGFGTAGSFESLLGNGGNGGGDSGSASSSSSDAFAAALQQQQQQQQQSKNSGNHPCHEGYNPGRASEGPSVNYASQPSSHHHGGGSSSSGSNNNNNNTGSRALTSPHAYHHHHHHGNNSSSNNSNSNPQAFFMSALAYNPNHHLQLWGAPAASAPGVTQQQADALSGFCLDQLQQLVAGAPLASQQQHSRSSRQQQQQHSHHQYSGSASLDELLLFNPGLLEAAMANANETAALQAAAAASHDSQRRHGGRNATTPPPPPTSSAAAPTASRHVSDDSFDSFSGQTSSSNTYGTRQGFQQQLREDAWLEELSISVPSLSVKPMSGTDVLIRLRGRMDDVLTRYIPCVDFLVQCQQELRKGLALANQMPRGFGCRTFMTPKNFFNTYIHRLPDSFYVKNQFTMEQSALSDAMQGLNKLRGEAEKTQQQGCEAIKNTFLGGMKDGESWGLRKWLSKNGNALSACTDLECILNACQKLDKSAESTRKLAEILRPLAQQTLDRLKNDVPASYQERSTAHPYLPFFHRLEAALRGMAQFDPEDDDVICIDDDDEIEEIKNKTAKPAVTKPPPKQAPPPPANNSSRKRKAQQIESDSSNSDDGDDDDNSSTARRDNEEHDRYERIFEKSLKTYQKKTCPTSDDGSSSGESDDESLIEIVDVKPPATKKTRNPPAPASADSSKDWICEHCAIDNADGHFCEGCGAPPPESSHEEHEKKVKPSRRRPAASSAKKKSPASKKAKTSTAVVAVPSGSGPTSTGSHVPWPIQLDAETAVAKAANIMADNLEHVATMFDLNQQDSVRPPSAPHGAFWNGSRYGEALRLFVSLLRRPESPHFLERIEDDQLLQAGSPPFSHVIKNPLCFRDIVSALIQNADDESQHYVTGVDGRLSVSGLSSWNMWKGLDLLQAIDLVLLNSLAYGKAVEEGKSSHRAMTNRLRRNLWMGIHDIVSEHVGDDAARRKECTPTRRSETSGFVVYKIRER